MSFVYPELIVTPFCALGTEGTDYIIPVQSSVDPNIMTQDLGYPPIQSTPLNAGGIPPSRAQTNGAFYLYSSILTWINVGGQFTFNSAIGANGYDAGAVLWAASKNQFVVSLRANNTADFVTTPAYINDGINWATLSYLEYPDITDSGGKVIITGANGFQVNNLTSLLGHFNAVVS